jgi:serine/threonine-protein kinase
MARAPSSAQPPSTQSAPPRANGELAIIVKPWATIWLNGRALSDGTPYRAQVPAGRYRIRIANDDLGKTEAVTVTVEPRKTTIVERTWQ